MNATQILEHILQEKEKQGIPRNKTITKISKTLNLARGTITRWLLLENVPDAYTFDLMKIAGMEIDYSKFDFKQKDQFFTAPDTAKKCYNIFLEKMKELSVDISQYVFIEPSAGSGVFLDVLPKEKTLAFDIEPRHRSVQKCDFLTYLPEDDKKYIVFGNPPFGLRGHLALSFVNHSGKFADFVCFILPQLFESDGKGSPRKRVKDYNLVHSEKIGNDFEFPDGEKVKVNVIFQIWSKHHKNSEFEIKAHDETTIKVYSLSNGDSPSQQRNTPMIGKCDLYLPSTCFGSKNMTCYDSFEDLPNKKGYGIVFGRDKKYYTEIANKIDWASVSFVSTNSALNLRKSKILQAFAETKS